MVEAFRRYVPRLIDPALEAALEELPAVLITGPRATGKTTSAERVAASVVQLDRPAEAVAFRADPDDALLGLRRPVLLDEWQEVPEVVAAVRRSVDRDPVPGSFVLTGSARGDLDAATWPGTGRLVRLPMYGLTVGERGQYGSPPFLDEISSGRLTASGGMNTLRGYIDLALHSGFPEASLRLSGPNRTLWLDSYVDQLLTRDALAAGARRDPERLRRYLEVCAVNTAGVVADKTIYDAAGVDRRTSVSYDALLAALYVVDLLPAWSSNRLGRLVHRPKRHLVEPALAAALLRVDAGGVLRDGDLLGRILESFVVAQLRAELPFASSRARLFHLRDEHGRREIDVLVEFGGGDVAGIEVKATAAPDRGDAAHLEWLRSKLGARFRIGIVLHTGPSEPFELSEHIVAAPISAIWARSDLDVRRPVIDSGRV